MLFDLRMRVALDWSAVHLRLRSLIRVYEGPFKA